MKFLSFQARDTWLICVLVSASKECIEITGLSSFEQSDLNSCMKVVSKLVNATLVMCTQLISVQGPHNYTGDWKIYNFLVW